LTNAALQFTGSVFYAIRNKLQKNQIFEGENQVDGSMETAYYD